MLRTCSIATQQSPYIGLRLSGRVERTLVRGITVYRENQIVSPPVGRLLRPIGSE